MIPGPAEPGGDEFIKAIEATRLKWAILTDQFEEPKLVLETDRYLREVLSGRSDVDPYAYCHRPILVTDAKVTLEDVLDRFVVEADHAQDRVVDRDVVLYWTDDVRRIVTGADIFGRLLEGIAQRTSGGRRRPPPAEVPARPEDR